MTKQEFIDKATDCGYDEEAIERFVEAVTEYEDIAYEDIYLVEHIKD